MTLEQYTAKRNEYIRKQEHYKKKLVDLDEKYFWELNKETRLFKYLNELNGEGDSK